MGCRGRGASWELKTLWEVIPISVKEKAGNSITQWPQPRLLTESPGDLLKLWMPSLQPRPINSEPLGVGLGHPQVILISNQVREPLLKAFGVQKSS